MLSGLRTGLKEQQAFILSVRLGGPRGHLPRVAIIRFLIRGLRVRIGGSVGAARRAHQIDLVADQRDDDAGTGLPLQLRHPVLRFDEAGRFRHVVDHQRGLGVAVVHGRQRRKALLACRVPDLEFDGAGREVAFLGQEGGADGRLLVFLEVVVHKTHHE